MILTSASGGILFNEFPSVHNREPAPAWMVGYLGAVLIVLIGLCVLSVKQETKASKRQQSQHASGSSSGGEASVDDVESGSGSGSGGDGDGDAPPVAPPPAAAANAAAALSLAWGPHAPSLFFACGGLARTHEAVADLKRGDQQR